MADDDFERTHICQLGHVSFAADDLDVDEAPGRSEIEPWMAALLQAEHCSLLLGSGFTIGACGLVGASAPSMNATLDVEDDGLAEAIEAEANRSASQMGRGSPNLEDRLRAAMAAAAGLQIVRDERAMSLQSTIGTALGALVDEILSAERSFVGSTPGQHAEAERTLTSFLMSFAGRTPTRDRLHIFTTNYDRLVEHICDAAGIRLLDRFVGALAPRFRSSRVDVDLHYNPPGIRGEPRMLGGVMRLSKLHGSVDWVRRGDWIERLPLAFGAESPPDDSDSVLVFPNSYKDYETAYFPYAELFRDFSSAAVRPNSVAVTYGYGFGDDHVNRILADMLSLPSTHLVLISFDSAEGRIARFLQEHGIDGQVSVLMGPHYADMNRLASELLPRPSIAELMARSANSQPARPDGVDSTAVGSDDELGE